MVHQFTPSSRFHFCDVQKERKMEDKTTYGGKPRQIALLDLIQIAVRFTLIVGNYKLIIMVPKLSLRTLQKLNRYIRPQKPVFPHYLRYFMRIRVKKCHAEIAGDNPSLPMHQCYGLIKPAEVVTYSKLRINWQTGLLTLCIANIQNYCSWVRPAV